MASAYTLDFEKPLLELERQIDDLKRIGTERQIDINGELEGLNSKLESLRADIYRNLPPLQRGLVARPPRRGGFWSRAPRGGRILWIISAPYSPILSSSTATGYTWTTQRSSADGPV